MIETPTLEGDTVLLRPLQLSDADELANAAAGDRSSYGLTPVPDGVAAAERYIKSANDGVSSGWRLPFAVVFRGTVVGSTSYIAVETWSWPPGSEHQRVDTPDVCEIGATWLGAAAQRTRCNTESKLLLLTFAFEAWEVHRVSFRTDERNTRSRTAIERLGARFEGIRRADLPGSDNTVRNSAYYSITASEWPTVRRTLHGRLARDAPGQTSK